MDFLQHWGPERETIKVHRNYMSKKKTNACNQTVGWPFFLQTMPNKNCIQNSECDSYYLNHFHDLCVCFFLCTNINSCRSVFDCPKRWSFCNFIKEIFMRAVCRGPLCQPQLHLKLTQGVSGSFDFYNKEMFFWLFCSNMIPANWSWGIKGLKIAKAEAWK